MIPSEVDRFAETRLPADHCQGSAHRVINGEDIPQVWSGTGDFQEAYDATTADVSEAIEAWRREVEHARRIEREAESLDVTAYNVRREAIDGTVGV